MLRDMSCLVRPVMALRGQDCFFQRTVLVGGVSLHSIRGI